MFLSNCDSIVSDTYGLVLYACLTARADYNVNMMRLPEYIGFGWVGDLLVQIERNLGRFVYFCPIDASRLE